MPYGISMVQADQLSDANVGNTKVCIIDSGFDLGHPDLQDVRVTGDDGYVGDRTYDTGNWYQDSADSESHGTFMAGIIGAIGGNGIGTVGVNPNNNLELHIVKVFNDEGNYDYGDSSFNPEGELPTSSEFQTVDPTFFTGSFTFGTGLLMATEQCLNAGAKVINMSLGAGQYNILEPVVLQSRFENDNVLFIAAAGNRGGTSYSYPASHDSVISVASIDNETNKAETSRVNDKVELAAPGVGIYSTEVDGNYAYGSGTSAATAYVSGVAALVWSHYPNCTNAQIRNALTETAVDLGLPGRDNEYGYGLVQAKAAFDFLAGGCDGPQSLHMVLAEPTDDKRRVKIFIPPETARLDVKITGGTGDADLYVKDNSPAFQNNSVCDPAFAPISSSNEESCIITNPEAGFYSIMVYGRDSFEDVQLLATFQPEPNFAPNAAFTYTCNEIDGKTTCEFDASPSSDVDGSIIPFRFKMLDDGNTPYFVSDPSHTFSTSGEHRVRLWVRDDDLASDSVIKTISIP